MTGLKRFVEYLEKRDNSDSISLRNIAEFIQFEEEQKQKKKLKK